MNKFLALVAIQVTSLLAFAQSQGWTDDFAAAKSQAAAEGKRILMVFSGSDWCGWCKKFDAETLSKSEFVKAASKKFVLVMVDSPRDKSKLSAMARTQNPQLVAKFGVRGYPSVVVTDADGSEIARSAGYVKGGPRAFLSKLDSMAGKAAAPAKAGFKPKCDCGPDCWEKGLCACCKKNKGNCCRHALQEKKDDAPGKVPEPPAPAAADGLTCRQVACWTVCTEDPELAGKVDETAAFLTEVLKAFDEETSSYFRTMQSYYDGILVHRDLSQRGKRERFLKGKCYLNLYAPDTLRTKSWCALFCDGFLSRCKKEPRPDKEREAILLAVGAHVTKALGIPGGDKQLEQAATEPAGMRRVLHELCATNGAAIRRYYAAKIHLAETDRFGPFLSLSDMTEMFSAAVGQDVFPLFQKYGLKARREDVSPKLKGFAGEAFE